MKKLYRNSLKTQKKDLTIKDQQKGKRPRRPRSYVSNYKALKVKRKGKKSTGRQNYERKQH